MTDAIDMAAVQRRIHNPLQQETTTFLETSEETGGARTLPEIDVAPGGGVRIHRHATYAERFIVREGVLTAQLGDRVT